MKIYSVKKKGDKLKVSFGLTRVYLERKDIKKVAIETNDLGPFVEDVFFHILTNQDAIITLPQSIVGDEVVDFFIGLPNFNCEVFIEMMSSTTNRVEEVYASVA